MNQHMNSCLQQITQPDLFPIVWKLWVFKSIRLICQSSYQYNFPKWSRKSCNSKYLESITTLAEMSKLEYFKTHYGHMVGESEGGQAFPCAIHCMGHNASWIGVAYHVITLSKSHDCEYVGPQMSHHILVEIPRKYINKVSELANPWIHLCWSLHSLLVYVVVCYIVDLPCVHISHAIPPFHFILFYV